MSCIYTSDVPCMNKCKDSYFCKDHKGENYYDHSRKYRSHYIRYIKDGLDNVSNAKGKEQKSKCAQSIFDFMVLHKQIFTLEKERFTTLYGTMIDKLNELAREPEFGEQLANEYKNKLNLDVAVEEDIEQFTYNINDIVIEIMI